MERGTNPLASGAASAGQQGHCHAGMETEIMDVTFHSGCEERGYFLKFISKY